MKSVEGFFGPYRWLSNFWPAVVVTKDGTEFETVEHAYQYEKFLDYPGHQYIRNEIIRSPNPAAAKRVADKYGSLVPKDWQDRKLDVMRRLLAQKFKQGSKLGIQLKKTGNANLVEQNTWGDKFWGVCHGIGTNWLGRLIMEVRREL